jgi:hypothetical protein
MRQRRARPTVPEQFARQAVACRRASDMVPQPDEGAARTSDKTLWPLALNGAVRSAARAGRARSATTRGLRAL